jgi:hypothetical protein
MWCMYMHCDDLYPAHLTAREKLQRFSTCYPAQQDRLLKSNAVSLPLITWNSVHCLRLSYSSLISDFDTGPVPIFVEAAAAAAAAVAVAVVAS